MPSLAEPKARGGFHRMVFSRQMSMYDLMSFLLKL
jgi:hypothetical protein